jgi:hypothetical protein
MIITVKSIQNGKFMWGKLTHHSSLEGVVEKWDPTSVGTQVNLGAAYLWE